MVTVINLDRDKFKGVPEEESKKLNIGKELNKEIDDSITYLKSMFSGINIDTNKIKKVFKDFGFRLFMTISCIMTVLIGTFSILMFIAYMTQSSGDNSSKRLVILVFSGFFAIAAILLLQLILATIEKRGGVKALQQLDSALDSIQDEQPEDDDYKDYELDIIDNADIGRADRAYYSRR